MQPQADSQQQPLVFPNGGCGQVQPAPQAAMAYANSPAAGPAFGGPVNLIYQPTTNNINVFNNCGAMQQTQAAGQAQQQQQGQLSPEMQSAFMNMAGGLMTLTGGLMTMMGALIGRQQQGTPQPAAGAGAAPSAAPAPADAPCNGTPPPAGAPPAPAPNASEKAEDTVRRAFKNFLGKDPSDADLKKYSSELRSEKITERSLIADLAARQE